MQLRVQLHEEMLDHGYTLAVKPNALKVMIPPPSLMGRLPGVMSGESGMLDVLPDGTTSSVLWRKAGVRYTQNEIYFDIEEKTSGIADAQGNMVPCDALTCLQNAWFPVVCQPLACPDWKPLIIISKAQLVLLINRTGTNFTWFLLVWQSSSTQQRRN